MGSPTLFAPRNFHVVQPTQIFVALLAIVLLYILYHASIWVYNIYFHPLAGYPGPLLSRASSLWYARSLSRGRIAQDTLTLHDRYGPVVRIAPDELSYINPENWKEIYTFKPGRGELIKDPRYHDTVKPTPTVLTGNWDEHSQYRKMLSPTFSERTLKDQENILHKYIDLFISRLHEVSEEGQKPVDMTAWWNFLTFDIIGFLAYGESFNCLTSPKLHDWIEATLNIAILMSLGQAGRQLPVPFDKMYKKWAIPESVRRNAKLHADLTKEKLQNRLQSEPSHMDVVNRMIAAYKNGEVPYDVLKEHASILTIGGSETTATLLAGATYYLATNPVVFRKLSHEVRAAFAKDEDITVAGANGCQYLIACIEESLRIYPPSPANHTRITPPEGIVLDGQFVPGGMAVGMPMYASFRSGRNFHNPDRFVPERWLGDKEYAGDKKHALQPFSVGPRNCLGRALAYQEIKLALAKLVWHFDIELCPESKNWTDQQNFTFWVKPQLWVNITPARRS